MYCQCHRRWQMRPDLSLPRRREGDVFNGGNVPRGIGRLVVSYRLNTEKPTALSVGFSYAGNKNNAVRVGIAGEF